MMNRHSSMSGNLQMELLMPHDLFSLGRSRPRTGEREVKGLEPWTLGDDMYWFYLNMVLHYMNMVLHYMNMVISDLNPACKLSRHSRRLQVATGMTSLRP